MKIVLGILLLLVGVAVAQVTTNWVESAPHFREVGGTNYNVNLSKVWVTLNIEPDQPLTNGMLAWKCRPIVVQPGRMLQDGTWLPPVVNGYTPDYLIAIKNCPRLQMGKGAEIRALPIGIKIMGDQSIETYDYGMTRKVAVVTTNKPAAK